VQQLIKFSRIIAIFALLSLIPILHVANASYTVTNLNVTLNLNQNTSTQVTEVLTVLISNQSVSQYSTNRLALNLSLSSWQKAIGPLLVEHIINSGSSIYNFKFLPGPIFKQNGQSFAYIILSYNVNNVTTVNETAPRVFSYKFNPKVFNFEHGQSGEVLTSNTTLTFIVPNGATITSVYPLPDLPVFAFENNYKNITQVSWLYGEPLSKFSFDFVIKQGLQTEVESFFNSIYKTFGIFMYVLLAIVIILSIVYIYMRATK
jgi:hypothetical protein